MKKLIGLTLMCLLVHAISFAGNYTWTGTINSSWDSTGNWNSSVIPTSSDTITINSTSNSLVLDGNRTVRRIVINSDTLDLGGDTLTVTVSAGMNGGTINNGVFNAQSSELLNFSGTTFNAVVIAKGRIKLNGCVFNNTASFEHNNSTDGTGSGGNIFNGLTTLKNSGTSAFRLAGANSDIFNNNVTISNVSAAGNLQLSYGATTYFNGNIEVSSTSSTISFSGSGDGSSVLDSGKTITIGSAGVAGTLLLRNFTQLSNTAQSLSLSGTLNLINSTFIGAFTCSASGVLLSTCNFYGTSNFTKTGTTSNYSAGGNQFFESATINNNATNSAILRFATTSGDIYHSEVILNTNTGFIQLAYSDTNEFKGDITINSSKVTFNNGNGIVQCTGGNAQEFGGSAAFVVGKLWMNKSTSTLTLQKAVTIDSLLTLTSGIVYTDSTNLLTLKAGGVATGASDSSYIDGPMKKIGNTAFDFHLGNGTLYAPLSISAPDSLTSAFIAEYGVIIVNDGINLDSTVNFIENMPCWSLNRSSGSSSVKVKLTWDNSFAGIIEKEQIKLAILSDSIWKGYEIEDFNFNDSIGSFESLDHLVQFGRFAIANASGGAQHSAVVCNNGNVNVWGSNQIYQHGDCNNSGGSNTYWPSFTKHNSSTNYSINPAACSYPALAGIKDVSAGRSHSLGLMCSGEVVSWGDNNSLQLGVGALTPLSFYSIAVNSRTNTIAPLNDIKHVAAGGFTSYAVTRLNGYVWAWGMQNNALANPAINPGQGLFNSAIPTAITYQNSSYLDNVIQVAPGFLHTIALLNNGRVVSWGRNQFGQLGIGNATYQQTNEYPQTVLRAINTPLENIIAISAGENHNLAIDSDGRLWTWGSNSLGQLGINQNPATVPIVTYATLVNLTNIVSISCGQDFSCALQDNGSTQTIYTWGNDIVGQLGKGASTGYTFSVLPSPVTFNPTVNDFSYLEAGDAHVLAMTKSGKIYGWGLASYYILARSINSPLFAQINGFPSRDTPLELTNYTPQQYETAICAPKVNCDDRINYCYEGIEISSSATWNSSNTPNCYNTSGTTELYIENELKIKAGKTLTVSGITLLFGPNGRIVLEEGNGTLHGAQLILESGSKLTAAADCMWKGIEVRGNKLFSSNNSRQAKLIVESGVLIEHAHTGILLGKWNSIYYSTCGEPTWSIGQSPFDLSGSGGVLECNNATFQNNAIDIRFAPYPKFLNSSRIENCSYHNGSGFLGGALRDKRYLLSGSPLYFVSPFFAPPNALQRSSVAIYDWNNYGITIFGNSFENYQQGIYAVDARKLVVDNCTFEDLLYGIRSEFTKSAIKYNGTFTENSFLNVEGQISLKGGRYDVISGNSFNKIGSTSGNQTDNFVGIYFNNSTGYKVVDNQFYELTYGINGINSGINSGSFIGYQTSGNVFNTTKWPVGLLFNNSGLQLKCNIFNNSNPTLYDNNWYMGGNSVLADQGLFSSTNEKAPSGNFFIQSPGYNQLFSDIGNPLFTYFRHGSSSPQEVIPAVQIGSPININAGSIAMSTFEEACEPIPPCDPPCERMHLQGFIEVLDSLSALRAELIDELDNQSRDALFNALQFPYSKDSLLNFLLNSSPLSDTILYLSINCIDSLPEENLEVVLSVNSPVSDDVWQSLKNRDPSLDPQTVERVLALQGVNPPYETVTRIDKLSKHYWNEYYLTTNDFYRRLSDQDSLDVIIDFLKTTGTTNNLQQAFTLYLSGNELDSAASLFETLSSIGEVEESWLSLNGMLMELAIQEKTIFEMDSSQLAIVEQVANTEEISLSKINAESILSMLNWEVYPYILPEGGGNRMYNTNSPRSIINDNKLLNIYPNPTDDHFFIIDKFRA